MCETTRKPNILANTRDKEVIHKNEVVGINYTKMTRQEISLCRTISLGSENFARSRNCTEIAKSENFAMHCQFR